MKDFKYEVESEVKRRFDQDFNCIPIDVVEKYYNDCLSESISTPGLRNMVNAGFENFEDWLEDENDEEEYG